MVHKQGVVSLAKLTTLPSTHIATSIFRTAMCVVVVPASCAGING